MIGLSRRSLTPYFKEKTLRYRFRMIHVPGVQHKAADSISHHPTGPMNPDMLILPDDVAATSDSVVSLLRVLIPGWHLL